MTSAVRSAVASGETATDLAAIGARAGYEPMLTAGLNLVARGETSRCELERVFGLGDVG
jgi:type II secretory ATPase GspE/PulE/Tfp pilus assembly ATPase PilB-like protein